MVSLVSCICICATDLYLVSISCATEDATELNGSKQQRKKREKKLELLAYSNKHDTSLYLFAT